MTADRAQYRRQFTLEMAHFALAPQTFAVMALLSIALILRRGHEWGVTGPLALTAFLLASLAVIPIAYAVARLLLRPMRSRPVGAAGLAIAVWLAVPVLRQAIETWVGAALGSDPTYLRASTILSTLIANLAWVAFLAAFQATGAMRRDASDVLENAVADLSRSSVARWKLLDEERTHLARSIRRTIAPTIDELSTLIDARAAHWRDPDFSALVQQVADRSRELVREASREMQVILKRSDRLGLPMLGPRTEAAPATHGRLAALPDWNDARIRIHPVVGPLLLFVILSPVAIGRATLWPIAQLAMVTALLALLLVIAGVIVHAMRGSMRRVPALLVVVISYAVCGVISFDTVRTMVDRVFPDAEGGNFSLWTFPLWVQALLLTLALLFCCLTSVWIAERQALSEKMQELGRTLAALDALELDMSRHYERMCAQTASMLHGPVQGRLATIAMMLRLKGEAISAADLDTCRQLLILCLHDLDRIAEEPVERPDELRDVARSLRAQWAGIIEIACSIDDEAAELCAADPDLAIALESLLADLVSNASRHGQARNLHLEIAADGREIRVTARDDGVGPQEPVEPGHGLGAVGVRGAEWQITRDGDGWCLVTVRLPPRMPERLPALLPR